MFYRTCPKCVCNLDPDERCDCEARKRDRPAATGTASEENTSTAVYQSEDWVSTRKAVILWLMNLWNCV